jgi:uncharacterized membrane protein (DUF2068 family)
VRREAAIGTVERPGGLGVRLIVGYKLAKAVAALSLGVVLLFLGSAGLARELREVATALRHHFVAAWSVELSEALVRAAGGRHLVVVAFALLLDGASSLVEGWALHRRYRWSRWLIVGATSCLLPFEVFELYRRLSPGRFAVLIVNAAIVVYLVRSRVETSRGSR